MSFRHLFAFALLLSAGPLAAECQALRASPDAASSWTNPHPAPSDVRLEFRGTEIVFRPIKLAKGNIFSGGERSIYTMGSADEVLFETPLKVRIASSIKSGDSGRMQLLMGKYEISKAQYAIIMGQGSLKDGLALLHSHSQDPDLGAVLSDYFEGPCKGVVTRRLAQTLAEPVSHLRYDHITAFIRHANESCVETPKCRILLRRISSNDLIPGFLRLPTEHEWEFAARGGEAFVTGGITREELQLDRPKQATGTGLLEFAHVGNKPDRLIPIGSKKPLFGLYDMLGNVEELMGNPFTSENGFGAVGAYVARGGNYRLQPEDVRVSKRTEFNQFILDPDRDQFLIQYFPTVGFRLVIGLPVAGGIDRVGSDELDRQFAQNYQPVDENSADQVGRTVFVPVDLPSLHSGASNLAFDLSPTYDSGHVRTVLNNYGQVKIKSDTSVQLHVSLSDTQGNMIGERKLMSGAHTTVFEPTLPGAYVISFQTPEQLSAVVPVSAIVAFDEAADTGVRFPTLQALATARSVSSGAGHLDLSGYVGADDKSDSYPIRLAAGYDAIKLELVTPRRRDLIVNLIDSNLDQVYSFQLARGDRELLLPAKDGFRGFLQITASDDRSSFTDYSGTAVAIRATDPIFARQGLPARNMTPGSTYSGILTRDVPSLDAKFSLTRSRKVRLDLSGLSDDVDLYIQKIGNSGSNPSHGNSEGTTSEIFVGDLDAGTYQVKLRRKSRSSDGVAQFDLAVRILGDATPKVLTLSQQRDLARQNAHSLNLSPDVSFHTLTVNITYFQLHVQPENIYDFIVLGDRDLDIFLETPNGRVLAKSTESGSDSPEKIRFSPSSAGISSTSRLYLRVESQDRLVGTTSAAILAKKLEPARKGSHFTDDFDLIARYKDWEVRWSVADDSCVARTLATGVNPPTGWREWLPYFMVYVSREDGGTIVSLDYIEGENLSYSNGKATASILLGSGYSRYRTLYIDDPFLQPLVSSRSYYDTETLALFRLGNRMTIRGRSDDGIAFSIDYSLLGYTAAIRHINLVCNANTHWLLGY